ncbi:MAG: hypothetical protein WD875_03920 [Pirellulales bacterium]
MAIQDGMMTPARQQRRQAAVAEFDEHEGRRDGEAVVARLDDASALLADRVFTRIHGDVEKNIGIDSFYNPLSEAKAESRAKAEVDAFFACEAALFAEEREYVRGGDRGGNGGGDGWCQTWIAALVVDESALGIPAAQRLASYRDKSADDRRRGFSLVLERAFPEATRAPLVIYRLLPLAIRLATAQAFERADHAQAQRDRQLVLLPSILDCTTCNGAVLPSGTACDRCGNPFWKYELLTAEW